MVNWVDVYGNISFHFLEGKDLFVCQKKDGLKPIIIVWNYKGKSRQKSLNNHQQSTKKREHGEHVKI